jgi:hypothetical protein
MQRPMLVLVLQNGIKTVATLAIVDSGADTCIFPASLAGQLGITIPNQKRVSFLRHFRCASDSLLPKH